MTSAGGLFCKANLGTVDGFLSDVEAFKKAQRVGAAQPIYAVTPLGGTFPEAGHAQLLNATIPRYAKVALGRAVDADIRSQSWHHCLDR